MNKRKEPVKILLHLIKSRDALPRLLLFHICLTVFLALVIVFYGWIVQFLLDAGGLVSLTSGNLGWIFTSWQGWTILISAMLLLMLCACTEINARILYCQQVLSGNRKPSFFQCAKEGLKTLPHFLTPAGILIMFWIGIIIPLAGLGTTTTWTSSLRWPEWILAGYKRTPLFYLLYGSVEGTIFILSFLSIYTLHAAILHKQKPWQAVRTSWRMFKTHQKECIAETASAIITIFLSIWLAGILTIRIPSHLLNTFLTQHTVQERVLLGTATMFCLLVCTIIRMLASSALLLELTSIWHWMQNETEIPVRKPGGRFIRRFLLASLAFSLAFGFVAAGYFDEWFPAKSDALIIAHRAGGALGAENTLYDLERAHEQGITAGEIDVQRTKDGYYVVTHDNTFWRTAHDKRYVWDMTLEEIQIQINILPLRPGQPSVTVSTIDQFLDSAKAWNMHLFVELKGYTADKQMADDLARLAQEKNMTDSCTFISLKYSLVDYMETTYPQLETGYIYNMAIGDTPDLNCECFIVASEAATSAVIYAIQAKGKKIYVWSVNSTKQIEKFLKSDIDGIITDQPVNARKVEKKLEKRSDFQRVYDNLTTFIPSFLPLS